MMTNLQNEQPIDMFAADYVLGNLTTVERVMLNAHMEIVSETSDWVENLDCLGGLAFECVDPTDLDDADAMLDNIVSSEDEDHSIEKADHASIKVDTASPEARETNDVLPYAIEKYIGIALDDIPWRRTLPGLCSYRMKDENGYEVHLLAIKPGKAMPNHSHGDCELTLVLKGFFSDENGVYKRGDIAFADENVCHKPVAGPDEECICFVINKMPLKFASSFLELASTLIRH